MCDIRVAAEKYVKSMKGPRRIEIDALEVLKEAIRSRAIECPLPDVPLPHSA
jgi:hypothetical protein